MVAIYCCKCLFLRTFHLAQDALDCRCAALTVKEATRGTGSCQKVIGMRCNTCGAFTLQSTHQVMPTLNRVSTMLFVCLIVCCLLACSAGLNELPVCLLDEWKVGRSTQVQKVEHAIFGIKTTTRSRQAKLPFGSSCFFGTPLDVPSKLPSCELTRSIAASVEVTECILARVTDEYSYSVIKMPARLPGTRGSNTIDELRIE
jgi:hypothetical protein